MFQGFLHQGGRIAHIQFQPIAPGSGTNYGDDFPTDLIVLPSDTITSTQHIVVCGADSVLLPTVPAGTNYVWWDSTTVASKVVKQPGFGS